MIFCSLSTVFRRCAFQVLAIPVLALAPGIFKSAYAGPKGYSKPNLTPAGIETAFTASQGDYYVYSYGYSYQSINFDFTSTDSGQITKSNRKEEWVPGGGVGLGFGLGSSVDSVALQLGYNLDHSRVDGTQGKVDIKVGRNLITTNDFQWALAGGVQGIIGHGRNEDNVAAPFIVTSLALPVYISNNRRTLQVNAGYGGGNDFRQVDSPTFLGKGIFASVGMEVSDNVGLSVGWAGKGLNATVSVAPVKGVPITLGLSGKNLSNYDDQGRTAVLTVSWGGNFLTPSF